MKITDAKFFKSAMRLDQCPRDGRPEVAFVGRSNVGKSTLLNTLLRRKALAKTSSTPGKTQTLNFFDINGKIYFVDLPGYGYAKVPKKLKAEWNEAMMDYLRAREPLRLVVALLDARHKPTGQDQEMQEILAEAGVPTLPVATKIDKLKRSERGPNLRRIRATLGMEDDMVLIPFSAVTREGLAELWHVIDEQVCP